MPGLIAVRALHCFWNGRTIRIGTGIHQNRLDGSTQHAAGFVDFLDGQDNRIRHGPFGGGKGSCERI